MSENGKLWPVLTFEVVFLIIDIAMGMSLSTLTYIKTIFIPLSIESYANVYVEVYAFGCKQNLALISCLILDRPKMQSLIEQVTNSRTLVSSPCFGRGRCSKSCEKDGRQ